MCFKRMQFTTSRIAQLQVFTSDWFLYPNPAKKWHPVINLKCPEQLHASANVQNGNSRDNQKLSHKRRMASFDRPDRCILSRPHTSRFSELTTFPCRQKNVSVQSSSVRVSDSTPRVHKIVKEAKLVLQSRGIRVHQYLDWLLRAIRHQCQQEKTRELIQMIHELGFKINFKKSELKPTQTIDFLGYHFDLVQGKVFPTEKKLHILQKFFNLGHGDLV